MSHASVVLDGLTLSSIFVNVGVNCIDDISSDTGGEDSRENNLVAVFGCDIFALFSEGLIDIDKLSMDHMW